MIKNLNDILTIIVLLVIMIGCIRIFIWSFVYKEDKKIQIKINRWQLIKDYNYNEEE